VQKEELWSMKKMLVLYRELAGYFTNCLRHLADNHNVRIDIVAYPVNAEAPFHFDLGENIRVFKRQDVDLDRLDAMVAENNYDLIFCGGWIDDDYMSLVTNHRHIPSLLGFDKQWTGSLKDHLSSLKARFTFRSHFDFAFVPGKEQVQFALHMGFKVNQIVQGAYACSINLYDKAYTQHQNQGPRKMWFAGRYIEQKGIADLFAVAKELLDGPLNDWELHCLGTGDMWNSRLIHPRIVHHGFKQPEEVVELISDGELFVLPSLYEPWGVVVHEFAVAGYPMILTDRVGARTAFLQENKNGIIVRAGHRKELKLAILQMASMSPEDLKKQGEVSRQLALQVTPESYAASILKMMRKR
jgi:glycosyltransferase involved in cell wall biosynthesis